ncbi:hypothetical protein J2X63_001462 [Agromyces sp. 3263]|uniref:hypothetical protein n=1 Tax=Agromyces sp. 3263 TaxID=2817750 RepID=UPI0028565E1B|nr:hypothetical protein [Agromyces sp. 3263]MDR6905776.1 hypothetical protein [Agromyces sp. 3263]
MTDAEITPSEQDDEQTPPPARATKDRGDGARLPEEFEDGGETVAEDTASGGAPDPAGESSDG